MLKLPSPFRSAFAFCALFAAIVSTASALSTVTLTQVNGFAGTTGGGEFKAVLDPTPSSLINLNAYSLTNQTSFADGSFETFCIESQVEFYPSHQYYVSTSNQVLGSLPLKSVD